MANRVYTKLSEESFTAVVEKIVSFYAVQREGKIAIIRDTSGDTLNTCKYT